MDGESRLANVNNRSFSKNFGLLNRRMTGINNKIKMQMRVKGFIRKYTQGGKLW